MPRLSIGCTFSDRIEALLDGRVAIAGFDHDLAIVEPQRLFRTTLREATYDAAELSMASHIAAVGRGDRTYVGVPVFLSRSFRHSNLYIRTDRGIGSAGDLAGRRIGVIDFQQTAALWVRGILADEHGVGRTAVEWIAGGLQAPVADDRVPTAPAAGIRLSRTRSTLDRLLRDGELDAVISPAAPPCFADPAVPVARMWPDPAAVERRWWRERRLFPIMHVLVVRRTLVEAFPDLPQTLHAAFDEARRLAAADLGSREFPKVALPWLNEHAARTRDALGGDRWSYGLEENRAELATMLRFAAADGLAPASLTPDALFG